MDKVELWLAFGHIHQPTMREREKGRRGRGGRKGIGEKGNKLNFQAFNNMYLYRYNSTDKIFICMVFFPNLTRHQLYLILMNDGY